MYWYYIMYFSITLLCTSIKLQLYMEYLHIKKNRNILGLIDPLPSPPPLFLSLSIYLVLQSHSNTNTLVVCQLDFV